MILSLAKRSIVLSVLSLSLSVWAGAADGVTPTPSSINQPEQHDVIRVNNPQQNPGQLPAPVRGNNPQQNPGQLPGRLK